MKSQKPFRAPEPLAIVGIGLRFPGGSNDPASFWKFLVEGRDAITEVPRDRWSIASFYDSRVGMPGRTHSKWGGFIEGNDLFDAAFFSITPQEAVAMDPQQRFLLEATWHAFEDAGRTPDRHSGENIGVWVGVSHNDYNRFSVSPIDHVQEGAGGSGAFDATGTAHSITANRISHAFNFTGPSMVLDTACSSSLVALDAACRALWSGECETAVVAGVNHILDPTTWIAFSAMGALSPEGRCKSFDASASGFVRSEGVGVVIVKPLRAALDAGNRIYACVRATSSNQDGHTPAIAMPNMAAQRTLIRHTLNLAGISPGSIDFVEAHGTGTAVGDPIEATAIGEAVGQFRPPGSPLHICSVKTQIGHLESAAGIAGLIKAALCLHHRHLPANLHFSTPNPAVDFGRLNLHVPQENLDLAGDDKGVIRAGVNSFGFGGSNAHAILESAPLASVPMPGHPPARPGGLEGYRALTLSARSQNSLRRLSASFGVLIKEAGNKADGIARAAAASRSALPFRLTVTGRTEEDLVAGLERFAGSEPEFQSENGIYFNGGELSSVKGPVFIFSGQGAQWLGMGRSLLRSSFLFRETIEGICAALKRLSRGRLDLFADAFASGAESDLSRTEVAQPAIFAVQVATAKLLESWGIRPAAVIGHSVGEVAAAHVAGALSFHDAIRVIYHRGSKMESTRHGKMLAVEMDLGGAEELIEPFGRDLSIAASNGPRSVSISGATEAIEVVFGQLTERNVFCRHVPVDYAFHSELMQPAKAKLIQSLKGIAPRESRIPIYSTVTGDELSGTFFDAEYWWRNVRETVRFSEAVAKLVEAGHRRFLEVNAHPVLQSSLNQCLRSAGIEEGEGSHIGTLRREEDDSKCILKTLAECHGLGMSVDWSAFHGEPGEFVELPPYPFDRLSYWRETASWKHARLSDRPHPFFLAHIPGPRPQWVFVLDRRLHPFFNDHIVGERIVFPASGYIELAVALGKFYFKTEKLCIESIEFQRVLFLPQQGAAPLIRIEFNPKNGSFSINSTSDPVRLDWTQHAIGRVRKSERRPALQKYEELEMVKSRCENPAPVSETYLKLEEGGLKYGPLFRGLTNGAWGGDECWSEIEVPASAWGNSDNEAFLLHPVLLDSAFHILALKPNKSPGTFLPTGLRRLRTHQFGARAAVVIAKLIHSSGTSYEADITLLDDKGEPVVELEGFRLQAIESFRRHRIAGVSTDFLLETWERDGKSSFIAIPGAYFPSGRTILSKVCPPSPADLTALSAISGKGGLIAGRIWSTLIKKGWSPEPGEAYTLKDVGGCIGLQELQYPLLGQWMDLLTRAGLLSAQKTARTQRWKVTKVALSRNLGAQWSAATVDSPSILTELLCVDHAIDRSLRRLVGEEDERNDDAGVDLIVKKFGHSLWSRPIRKSLVAILSHLIEGRPMGHQLKILELCSADRQAASWLVSQLPPGSFQYLVSDPDPDEVTKLAGHLQSVDSVECHLFDPSLPLSSDTVGQFSSDVVFAIYPRSFDEAELARIRRLIRPGGILLLVTGAEDGDPFLSMEIEDQPTPLRNIEALLDLAGFVGIVSRVPGQRGPHRYLLAEAPCSDRQKSPARSFSGVPGKRSFLIFSDRNEVVAGHIVKTLHRLRAGVTVVPFAQLPETRDSAAEILKRCPPGTIIVYLAGMDSRTRPDASSAQFARQRPAVADAPLFLAQALEDLDEVASKMGLWIITAGVQEIPGITSIPNISLAPLAGLARVIQSELRGHRVVQADLSNEPQIPEMDQLIHDLLNETAEDQMAYRGISRWFSRAVHCPPNAQAPTRLRPIHEKPSALISKQPGVFDHLSLEKCQRRMPKSDEIEVEVRAAGLNFRDVMKALAIYPSDAEDANLLGDDFAGIVLAVGSGVRGLKPGDRVVGVCPGCFRTHLTLPAAAVFEIPEPLTFEEAATIPSVYLTAWFALHELARLRSGERILIHAGAGGVGLAAIRLALEAGATVYATAGSERKKEYLLGIGVTAVYSSRTLEFADELLAETNKEGVDVVLNSLAGEAIQKSLECLREGGRFLELGKRDIYENTEIGLRPFRNCLSYHSIDLSRQFTASKLKKLVGKIRTMIESGTIRALPHTVFPVVQAEAAFRYMAQGRHIGKIVLSFEDQLSLPDVPIVSDRLEISSDGSHLITGGTRGFGLEVARFLVDRGARHLVLVSRTGKPDDTDLEKLAAIRAAGASVHLRACDVADEPSIKSLLEEIRRDLPPLRGVFHAAMHLADEVLVRMSTARFHEVLAPKISGGWNLHLHTRKDPIDFFVLFSSISVLVGNPGQSNYVAANAFLDSLAGFRQGRGLPGLSIALDRLSESGYAARTPGLAEHFERMGWKGLTNEEACRGLELLLQNGSKHIAISNIDWSRWRSTGGHAAKSPRFQNLVREELDAAAESLVERIRQRYFSAKPEERLAIVEEFVTQQVAKVLRISPNRLLREKPLNEQGLDSLMAVELFGVLENQLGVPIPPSQLIENPTIAKASAAIARVLDGQDSSVLSETTEAPRPLPNPEPSEAS